MIEFSLNGICSTWFFYETIGAWIGAHRDKVHQFKSGMKMKCDFWNSIFNRKWSLPSNCIYLKYSLYIFINVSCGLTEILSMVLENLVKSCNSFSDEESQSEIFKFFVCPFQICREWTQGSMYILRFSTGFNETFFICHTFLASCIPFLSNIPACIYNEGRKFSRCPKTILFFQYNEMQCSMYIVRFLGYSMRRIII